MWYVYTMESYSATKRNETESVEVMWMNPEPAIQSEVSQKEKHQYSMLMQINGIYKYGSDDPRGKTAKET